MKMIYLAKIDEKYAVGLMVDKSKATETYSLRENDVLGEELFPVHESILEKKAIEFEEFFKSQR